MDMDIDMNEVPLKPPAKRSMNPRNSEVRGYYYNNDATPTPPPSPSPNASRSSTTELSDELMEAAKLDPEVIQSFREGTDALVSTLNRMDESLWKDFQIVNTEALRSSGTCDLTRAVCESAKALLKKSHVGGRVDAIRRTEKWLNGNFVEHTKERPTPLMNPQTVKALRGVFSYLDTKSLKRCRSVCQHWNEHATPVMNKKKRANTATASVHKSQTIVGPTAEAGPSVEPLPLDAEMGED